MRSHGDDAILAALPQLHRLALTTRPDWNDLELRSALKRCTQAGWPWPRILLETVHLMIRPGSQPFELLQATVDPVRRAAPPPGTTERGAALARELLRVAGG